VIIAVVLLVVIVGGLLVGLGFAGTGPLKSLKSGGGSNGGTTLVTYTSPDNTFSVGYPTGWQTKSATSGMGVEFTGPSQQIFEVLNFGANSALSPDDAVSIFCMAIGTKTAGPSSATISNQQWTREECETSSGTIVHTLTEAVTYKGQLFQIVYASLKESFASNQSQFFTPMEQSFKFLS
jgi:hypothetical protein